MDKKVILMSIDGMRPDGLMQCGSEHLEKLMSISSYTFNAQTVFPSKTLPCHMSLFLGVPPMRHGIITNTFVPQVHEIKGIFEKIRALGGECAFFYGWEPLRDIALPSTLKFATYINAYMKESSDTVLTDEALRVLGEDEPDFCFLYMVETDEKGGHDNGWMSEEYLRRISIALDNVKRVIEAFGDKYSIIIMADHGGHDRSHGSTLPEDMTIPLFFYGERFEGGKEIGGLSLLDIAPTIADLMGFEPEKEWEGHSVI